MTVALMCFKRAWDASACTATSTSMKGSSESHTLQSKMWCNSIARHAPLTESAQGIILFALLAPEKC
ncbi:hypothetical protein WJX79_000516 [Trebouxia sp. C0005]